MIGRNHIHKFSGMALLCCLFSLISGQLTAQDTKGTPARYQCLPCGRDCDTLNYNKPGKCPHCGMELVKKTSLNLNAISPDEICAYLKEHPGILLLDVRTKEEFEGKAKPDYGTLKNAINIPVQQLEARLAELANYKNREIIVYCSHSQRSPRAGYLLLKNGFTKVTNMAGGMSVMKDSSCKK